MAHFIDKDALVEEIERLMTPECGYSMNKLIDFLESLEVKEVDLEKKKSSDEVLKIRQEVYQSGYNDGYKHGCEDTKKKGE